MQIVWPFLGKTYADHQVHTRMTVSQSEQHPRNRYVAHSEELRTRTQNSEPRTHLDPRISVGALVEQQGHIDNGDG